MSTPPAEPHANSPEQAPAPTPPADPAATRYSTDPDGTRYSDDPLATRYTGATAGPASDGFAVPGYEILGELGRGGMGVVYRGHDPEIDRDLAVKVLRDDSGGEDAVCRFLGEGRIGGQLQHPGVVPVYAMGRLPDRRPYFTMKLIEGNTLAALLQQRTDPSSDLPRFLQVFGQVCQTMAYAHSRGVIHRDLKPSNVIVGSFGEVQVLDWGLAKALGASGEKARAARPGGTAAPADASEAGAVLGTPAYMAPEQARGETDRLDARCDVFGLGAVLCAILTGAPPYRDRQQGVLVQATRADLADAFDRLDGCGAEAELVRLAKACLAPAPSDRPADAGAVADAVTAYLAGVQDRLRQAELARAAAQAKAAEERKRRRLTLALAATVLLAVTGAGAGVLWFQQDRAARAAADAGLAAERARKAAATERDVTAALEEAAALGRQASGLHDDPTKWEAALAEARSAVRRADGVLNSGVDDAGALRPRVDAARTELEAADKDRRMVARLEEARFQQAAAGNGGRFDYAGMAALYAAAFREDGLDLSSPEAAAAERINGRAIRDDLLAALANWSNGTPNEDEKQRVIVQRYESSEGQGWPVRWARTASCR